MPNFLYTNLNKRKQKTGPKAGKTCIAGHSKMIFGKVGNWTLEAYAEIFIIVTAVTMPAAMGKKDEFDIAAAELLVISSVAKKQMIDDSIRRYLGQIVKLFMLYSWMKRNHADTLSPFL